MKSFQYRITGQLGQFVRRYHYWFAGSLIGIMAVLGLGSMSGNSAITDEVAHIPAAYSYLHFGDYRLNPEHPPLIKDLAGIPLQFMHLKFPSDLPAWKDEANGQWETGWNFIYHIGNNADAILFWARLPILLLALGFGVFLYEFCRRRWGTSVALLSLFFYTLSPSTIAHSTLVTTDAGASIFIFVALVTFARYMAMPNRQNFILLSLGLATAQLAKFSAVMLYPFLFLVTLKLIWAMPKPRTTVERWKVYMGGLIGASALSVVWIWLVYTPQVWNMPASVQDRLIEKGLYSPLIMPLSHALMNMNDIAFFKPIVQYIAGLTMVLTRVVSGNVTYFNGQVTETSFHGYFPELLLFKTQIAFVILFVAVAAVAVWRLWADRSLRDAARKNISTHVFEWTLGWFALVYFAISVAGNLNLGIRHILPVYLPLFVLVALGVVTYIRKYARGGLRVPAQYVVAALLVWYGAATVLSYPNYLSYFNEIIGGSSNADEYFSDSSVDWGQDLRRLKIYVDNHPEVNHLAIDYFGGGVPQYYFCPRKYNDVGRIVTTSDGYDCSKTLIELWHSQYGRYSGGFIAVSETFLENDRYYAAKNGTPGYDYLRQMKPVAKIGNSIYLFDLR